MAERALDKYLTPRYMLPTLLVAVVVVALLTPSPMSVDKATHLTSYSVEGAGARGFYQSAERLGWRVSRLESPLTDSISRTVTYAVLAPVVQPTSRELHSLLDAVREGASLLYVTSRGSEIIDSLGLRNSGHTSLQVDAEAGVLGVMEMDVSQCARVLPGILQYGGLDFLSRSLATTDSFSFDTVTFVLAKSREERSIIAMGIHFGRGRIAIASEDDMFRNDVFRRCDRKEGALAIRMLGWLAETAGHEVVFDEFHHGYDNAPGALTVVRRAVVASPSGRVAIQVALAAVILLMSSAARPLPPRPREAIERRSPFEHVGALARAYEKVGATRRATRLFVRGLRRRHDAASWRGGSDEKYLRTLALGKPKLAKDVDILLDAVKNVRTPAEFIEVGKAVEHIERTLSSDDS